MKKMIAVFMVVSCGTGCVENKSHQQHRCNMVERTASLHLRVEGSDTAIAVNTSHTFKVLVESFDKAGLCIVDPATLRFDWKPRIAEDGNALVPGPGASAIFRATRPGNYSYEVTVSYPGIEPVRHFANLVVMTQEQYAFPELRGEIYRASKYPCCPDPSVDPKMPSSLAEQSSLLNMAENSWLRHDSREASRRLKSLRNSILMFHKDDISWQPIMTELNDLIGRLENQD